MMNLDEFQDEQKQYLQGFMQGADLARVSRGLATFSSALGLAPGAPGKPATKDAAAPAEGVPSGPDAVHFLAQNKFLAEGKKLSPPEEAKRRRHPLDAWDDIVQHSASE